MPKKRRAIRKSPSVAAVAGRGSAAKRSSTPTTRIRKIKRYGWIPDIPDQRDYLYAAPPVFLRALPPRIVVQEKGHALMREPVEQFRREIPHGEIVEFSEAQHYLFKGDTADEVVARTRAFLLKP